VIEVADAPVPGVNLVGYLDAELGLGEIARKFAGALELAQIPFAALPYAGTPSRRQHRLDLETTTRAPFDTNIVCLNADEISAFAADVGTDLFARRYSIAVWFWETSVFRDFGAQVFFDEIWTASEYVREVVAQRARIPVHVAPIPFEAPSEPALSREDLGLPPGFVFLFIFDFVSAERKNPLAVVDAFRAAFEPDEGPTLVLKSINGRERSPRELEELLAATSDRGDILVLDGYVSAKERDAFVASCDCFVSLHRSEGLGLTIAEAISHGKPVIATGYSGNLDFMDRETSYLVPYRLVGVPERWWAFEPGAVWAEQDVGVAAEMMTSVWENPTQARVRGDRARDQLLQRFTMDRTAGFVSGRLAELRVHGAQAERSSGRGAREPILEASELLLTDAAETFIGSRSAVATRVRAVLRRALWPYLERERHLDTATLRALVAIQRSVEALAQRVRSLETSSHPGTTDSPDD
jgi:glycosyltransferase involved in cell wall biosynthesis